MLSLSPAAANDDKSSSEKECQKKESHEDDQKVDELVTRGKLRIVAREEDGLASGYDFFNSRHVGC